MFVRNLMILTVLISVVAYSQDRGMMPQGKLSGRILDAASGEPIEYANIVIFNQNDSSQVTGGVTGTDGRFDISTRPGRFYVDILFIGYERERIDNVIINRNNLEHNTGDIRIKPTSVALGDVVVEGEKAIISYRIDKKVIDVDQMGTTISGNAADVLENIPSITVDVEGNVSLRGSGSFTVLIDGRPTIMDAQDALQQIPASTIDDIEIITNPSARYNPEGTAGIINIILKKNTGNNRGFAGMANLNGGSQNNLGGDILLEYSTSSTKSLINVDYNDRRFPGETREERIFGGTNFLNSAGASSWNRKMMGVRGTIEFTLSPADILSLGARFRGREMERSSDLIYKSFNASTNNLLNYRSYGSRGREMNTFGLTLNYMHRFEGKGHQLTGDFSFESGKGEERNISESFQLNNSFIDGRLTLEEGPDNEFNGRIEYVYPLGGEGKIETGVQGEYERASDNLRSFSASTDGNYNFEPLYSYNADYNMGELALYSTYSGKIENIGYQAGIRGEYTYRKTELAAISNSFLVNRWDYFPTFHLSYNFTGGEQIMASYTRRLTRPRPFFLDPFEIWVDANNIRRGNPSLEPEFINSFELGTQLFLAGIAVTGEVYYQTSSNKIEMLRSVHPDYQAVSLTTFDNVGRDYSLGTELMLNIKPLPFWDLNLMGNAYNYRIEGEIQSVPFERESFNWRGRASSSFKIFEATQLQLTAMYNSPSVSSQGRREEFVTTDLALRQDLFNRSLTLTLQVRDLFNSMKHEFTQEGINFYSSNYFSRQGPTVMLNVRYSINNYRQERRRPDREDSGEMDDF
jgi:outer membrane receptor for ferrienterochelin and colicin